MTRTQGSSGPVSATVTASGGSATPGVHYAPLSTSVHFADGDTSPRTVPFEILLDGNAEPDRTAEITLSEPGGCAALGAQASALLTILDDDRPPTVSPTFTVGGTLRGLLGGGLVLHESTSGESIAPGNGPFAFSQPRSSGGSYSVEVHTQPSDPLQVCSVSQGSGTLQDHDVTDIAVQCTTATGESGLDPSFGGTGKVTTAFGGSGMAMALQTDGKIVVVGGTSSDFVLARYDVDGGLDQGFGSAGLVTTDLGSTAAEEAHAVAIQADGKIVVAGFTVKGLTPNNASNFDFALARYESDGSLDLSFGTGGSITTDFNSFADRAFAVAIQSDGRIVVAGSTGFGTPSGVGARTDYGVARYEPNGTLDQSFGSAGLVMTDLIGGSDNGHAIAVQPADGTIVVSGRVTSAGVSSLDHTGVVRYTPSGELDGSFGSGGRVTLMNSNLGEGLALLADGRILLAGNVKAGVSLLALGRLAPDGSDDDSFGVEGRVMTSFTPFDDFGRAVAVDEAGRIVAVGRAGQGSPANADFAVARYQANGALDQSFGSSGTLTIDFFGAFDGAESVALQPDGGIVVAGSATNGTRARYALARIPR